MYFTKTRKFILAVLVAIVSFAFVGVFYTQKVHALSTSDTVTYPFATGDYALANAPTVAGHTAQTSSDTYQYIERRFDSSVNLTSATYVGVEFENVTGNPGLTLGVVSQGARFGTYGDGKKVYFVNETGAVTELSSMYDSVNLGEGAKGMILLPISSLQRVAWPHLTNESLAQTTAFYFETNAEYNWGFSFKVGEICYYNEDPFQGGQAINLLDLSNGMKKDKTYGAEVTVEFPASSSVDNIAGMTAVYPFAKGEDAFENAMVWVGTPVGDSSDNWQTFRIAFDSA